MKEPDVELLYDLVPVGTPVEITYNRIVIEKSPKNSYLLYLPGWVQLSAIGSETGQASVGGLCSDPFVSDESIAAKLRRPTGSRLILGKLCI